MDGFAGPGFSSVTGVERAGTPVTSVAATFEASVFSCWGDGAPVVQAALRDIG